MSDIKSKVQSVEPSVQARDVKDLANSVGNIYEALAVISKRANQVANDLKQELHGKLQEFAVATDTIEEVQENKEQIEISKFYERLPNPATIAFHEFVDGDLEYRYRDPNERRSNEESDQ